MASEILLDRFHSLPGGLRVRLRLAQARDLQPIRALLGADSIGGAAGAVGVGGPGGAASAELDAARLVRFDPRRRVVICATALIRGAETIVGIGAIDVDAAEPDTLWVEEAGGEGLRELLIRALRSRADAISRRRAA